MDPRPPEYLPPLVNPLLNPCSKPKTTLVTSLALLEEKMKISYCLGPYIIFCLRIETFFLVDRVC